MVERELIWFTGTARTGKTARLIQQFQAWMRSPTEAAVPQLPSPSAPTPGVLLLAAIGDNRLELVDRLTTATHGQYPVYSTTPLGFVQDEVTLFYPLLVQALNLKAQFPLRLNPENELELATHLWRPELDEVVSQKAAVNESRLVRRVLDILQLAALAGMPIADIPTILQQGLGEPESALPLPFAQVGVWLEQWQDWCLHHGFLSYGVVVGLYWQHLLPHPTYQQHLRQRFQVLLADDVDEYPAIARDLFEVLIHQNIRAAFTFNPDGAVRLGLGADPTYLAALADRCEVVPLTQLPQPALVAEWGEAIVDFVINPLALSTPSAAVQSIQAASRAELLRQTAEVIIAAVQSRQVQPQEIAVIAPGMDAIARYAFSDILSTQGIPVTVLNEQRPLNSFPIVRALLALLAMVYPNLGRLVDRDAIAEMLVVLTPTIDPVRAGLLADYCFAPHPERPRLLPATTFPRWDRLGYQVADAYQGLIAWMAQQQEQLEQRLIPNPVALCDRAIQHFFLRGGTLPYNQLVAIRQFIETAQHYWEVNQRLRSGQRGESPTGMALARFILLLRAGAITANSYPVQPIGPERNAVTLANVFQYRSNRGAHRWHFWLDAASPRWLSGVDSLFAAPLFLHEWSGHLWTSADTLAANEQRLRRILLDLLARAEDRVYLCHSELATSGQEQTGVLLPLVNVVPPLNRVQERTGPL